MRKWFGKIMDTRVANAAYPRKSEWPIRLSGYGPINRHYAKALQTKTASGETIPVAPLAQIIHRKNNAETPAARRSLETYRYQSVGR